MEGEREKERKLFSLSSTFLFQDQPPTTMASFYLCCPFSAAAAACCSSLERKIGVFFLFFFSSLSLSLSHSHHLSFFSSLLFSSSSLFFPLSLSLQSCSEATEPEIAALFTKWNDKLGTQDPDQIVPLYAEKSVLLPTLSNTPR